MVDPFRGRRALAVLDGTASETDDLVPPKTSPDAENVMTIAAANACQWLKQRGVCVGILSSRTGVSLAVEQMWTVPFSYLIRKDLLNTRGAAGLVSTSRIRLFAHGRAGIGAAILNAGGES